MNFDLEILPQFKATIEDIVKSEINKAGITNYISAVVYNTNTNGTIDVYLPPNKKDTITGLLNKSGELLKIGDSVEIVTKNGSLSNAWIALKHGLSESSQFTNQKSSGGSGGNVKGGLPINSVIGFDDISANLPSGFEITEESFGLGETLKIGTILHFAGNILPEGYMRCDGSAISRETYSELFEIIGTTYGAGDGVTTFNIPDFSGRVAVGNSGDTYYPLGGAGGEKTHTLTVDEIPNHAHTMTSYYDDANYNTGTIPSDNGRYSLPYDAGNITRTQSTNAAGGGQAHNNMQPYLVINYIIKVSNTTPIQAQVLNEYSTSTTDTYSASYINANQSSSVWNGGDRVAFYKGTTTQVNNQEIINGQLLYNTDTGETALDDNDIRIITGSGNVVVVSETEPTNVATKEWIKPSQMVKTAAAFYDDYSTSELKTNKVWIDGKPVYRKVYTFQATSQCNLLINHNLTNVDKMWINQGTSFLYNDNESLPLCWYYSTSDWGRAWLNTTQIRFRTGADIGTRTGYLVVEYTKTTD